MRINWQSEGTKRVYTGAAIVAGLALFISLRFLTVWIFDVFILALACIAVWEVMRVRKSASKGLANYYIYAYIFLAYMFFILGYVSDLRFWLHLIIQFALIVVVCFYIFIMNYTDKKFVKEATLKKQSLAKNSWASSTEFLKIVLYPFLLLCTLIIINHLGEWATYVCDGTHEHDIQTHTVGTVGMLGVLLVFVIGCFTDTFAFIIGRLFKGKRLVPKISPNKTISGLIGGLFGGLVGSLLVLLVCTTDVYLQEFLTSKIGYSASVQLLFAGIGIVGSLVTQVGDIYASWLKRRNDVKDFGNYLPGHGGAMDRLDGISFNSVFICLVMMLIVFI